MSVDCFWFLRIGRNKMEHNPFQTGPRSLIQASFIGAGGGRLAPMWGKGSPKQGDTSKAFFYQQKKSSARHLCPPPGGGGGLPEQGMKPVPDGSDDSINHDCAQKTNYSGVRSINGWLHQLTTERRGKKGGAPVIGIQRETQNFPSNNLPLKQK